MKLDLEQAKQEIAQAPSDDARLAVLLAKSAEFYRASPKEAEKWAREALKLAKKLDNAEAIAGAHYRIGCALYQLSNPKAAAKEFEKAIELFDSQDKVDGIHQSSFVKLGPTFGLGLALAKQGRFREAFIHYDRALALSSARKGESRIDILGAIGNAALDQGDYPKALEYQYKSLAILDISDDPLRRSVVLSNIGRIYLAVHDLLKADLFFERSYRLKKDLDELFGLASAASSRGPIAQLLGDEVRARQYYQEALQVAAQAQRKDIEPYVQERLGQLELDRGDSKKAALHFRQAVERAGAMNLTAIWCASLIGEGRCLIQQKKAPEGIRALLEANTMSEQAGLLPLQCECASALASAYETAGKWKESIRQFNRYIALNAEVNSEQKQRALVEISARVEIEKADRERARMEALAHDAHERAELLQAETEQKSKELTSLALQLVERNEFLSNLREEIEEGIPTSKKARSVVERITNHIRSDRDWETFEHQFNQVHRDFLRSLSAKCPTLTPTELKISALIKLHIPTKAIANLLSLSPRTVENHRQSIRRKLKLDGEDNLVSVLIGLGGQA